ncbi:MAG: TIGR04283 family arsenosugar biosynthesis glycosyltransferase [Pseudomonadota bacterium]
MQTESDLPSSNRAPLSVVIPTLNASPFLPACLEGLFEGVTAGLIRELIVADGGSADETVEVAAAAGARVIRAAPGRGGQLAAGANSARGEWLLFLHGDTRLDVGWSQEVMGHLAQMPDKAAVFRLRFGSGRAAFPLWPWLVARSANLRARIFALPYGDQGFLISKKQYTELGGYAPISLFEDVDLVQRYTKAYGRKALKMFAARAITSPERYERDGYWRRIAKNQKCLWLYLSGTDIDRIAEEYRS